MLHSLDFSHERNIGIEDLKRRLKSYYPEANFDLLTRAFEFAKKAHEGQKRSSGEDYIIHPVNVAATLIKLRMDIDSIIVGLLHDVVEDCNIGPQDIEENFGVDVRNLVVGLTKISKIKFKTKEEGQAENFRKMVIAMSKDIRVIIVKLADRMHNMRTLQYISTEKQYKIAEETLDIYVPLASRLGISSVKSELEDICLRFLHPDTYYNIAENINMKKSEKDTYIKETILLIQEKLNKFSVKAEIKGRPKHFFSIYKKMIVRKMDYNQIQDILAFRIITQNITECYKVLGIIHSFFTPIPGRFKDFIAMPKSNGYQSLHTTVMGPHAERIEVQIRTSGMDEVAETGVAAHWKYKEGIHSGNTKLDWIESLLEINKNVESSFEFMDVIKSNLDVGGIFVFTPDGDVRELPYDATSLDFAYAIHSEVGNKMVGAKVNGKMVSFRHLLNSGDTVEILTSKNQKPSRDWIKIAKTSKAKTRIKQWILRASREENKQCGYDILKEACKISNTTIERLEKSNELETARSNLSCSNIEELFIKLGLGKVSIEKAIENIPSLKSKEQNDDASAKSLDKDLQKLNIAAKKKSTKDDVIIVDGIQNISVRIAKCCNPIPGDQIIGYVTRKRGISVHTRECVRAPIGNRYRTIKVEWNNDFNFKHPVNIRVVTHDKSGILSQISQVINKNGINIRSSLGRSLPNRQGSFIFEIEVNDYSDLLKIMSSIKALEEVITVHRV